MILVNDSWLVAGFACKYSGEKIWNYALYLMDTSASEIKTTHLGLNIPIEYRLDGNELKLLSGETALYNPGPLEPDVQLPNPPEAIITALLQNDKNRSAYTITMRISELVELGKRGESYIQWSGWEDYCFQSNRPTVSGRFSVSGCRLVWPLENLGGGEFRVLVHEFDPRRVEPGVSQSNENSDAGNDLTSLADTVVEGGEEKSECRSNLRSSFNSRKIKEKVISEREKSEVEDGATSEANALTVLGVQGLEEPEARGLMKEDKPKSLAEDKTQPHSLTGLGARDLTELKAKITDGGILIITTVCGSPRWSRGVGANVAFIFLKPKGKILRSLNLEASSYNDPLPSSERPPLLSIEMLRR